MLRRASRAGACRSCRTLERTPVATFVHIADERYIASIRRSGLKLPRLPVQAVEGRPVGVFALPVVQDFVVSHQWVRELKRRGFKVAVGVYFRVPDAQEVWAGRYNEDKKPMSAAQATARLANERSLGYEVIIPRSVAPSEIQSVRALPQTVGWRYFPGAHGRGIFCGCKYCQRGQAKSRAIQQRYEQGAL
jgi:hypothetical protein